MAFSRSHDMLHTHSLHGLSRTQARRQQRKYSQACYQFMVDKLMSVVKPSPPAVAVTDLESFRSNLYASVKREDALIPADNALHCNWQWMLDD